ncbi:MAG: hypothetical protein JXJ17_15990 [Anaerolineae bacterium]|nr:hypothetical protein [Anaerolineae bacterium]
MGYNEIQQVLSSRKDYAMHRGHVLMGMRSLPWQRRSGTLRCDGCSRMSD